MVDIRFAGKILDLVINKKETFVQSVNDVFINKNKMDLSSTAINIARTALRHFYLFEHILKAFNIELDSSKKALLFALLADYFYVKSSSKINEILANDFPNELEQIQTILKSDNPCELIKYPVGSDSYFSAKFNAPVWICKMIRKHFDDKNLIDFLKTAQEFDTYAYRINTLKDINDYQNNYPKEQSKLDDVLLYKNEILNIQNDELIPTRLAFNSLINSIYNPFHEILVYSGYDNDFIKNIIVKSNFKQSINVAVPCLDNRGELMRFIRKNGVKNVNLFEAHDKYSLKAGVSLKQDVVIVYPKSSSFDLLNYNPEYLMQFDQNRLDELISNEKEALELTYDYVNFGSELIYMTDTLNKKEGQLIIEDFLNNHDDFELIKEEQLLANTPLLTTMYFAILRRKEITGND